MVNPYYENILGCATSSILGHQNHRAFYQGLCDLEETPNKDKVALLNVFKTAGEAGLLEKSIVDQFERQVKALSILHKYILKGTIEGHTPAPKA